MFDCASSDAVLLADIVRPALSTRILMTAEKANPNPTRDVPFFMQRDELIQDFLSFGPKNICF